MQPEWTMPKKKNRPIQYLKPVFHIYCEGAKTEPNYLNGYIDKHFPTNQRLKVIKIEPTKKNTPVQLVEAAVGDKQKYPDGDVFWVVYDRESEQKYADKHHATAYNKAQRYSINLAMSNVCFEVWLLLHFQENTAPFCSYDDLKKNSILRTECKKRGFLDYDKADQSIFSVFTEEEINKARDRAKKMNELTEQSVDSSRTRPYHWNPYTDVYKLLNAIDKFAKKQK